MKWNSFRKSSTDKKVTTTPVKESTSSGNNISSGKYENTESIFQNNGAWVCEHCGYRNQKSIKSCGGCGKSK